MQDISNNIIILYATHSGNARFVAEQLNQQLIKLNIGVECVDCAKYNLTRLPYERKVIFIISTQGEGEPPDDAIRLFSYLSSTRKISLNKTFFTVFSLGDETYPLFCKAGDDLEALLVGRGASSFLNNFKVGIDFRKYLVSWFKQILKNITESSPTNFVDSLEIDLKEYQDKGPADRKCLAEVLEINKLCDWRSTKQIVHVSLDNSVHQLSYQPGDLALVDTNYPENYVEIITKCFSYSLVEGYELLRDRELLRVTLAQINRYLAKIGENVVNISDKKLDDYDWIKVLQAYPPQGIGKKNISFTEFVELLPPKSERLYSISSSPSYHLGEIHLTVRQFSRDTLFGRGLTSGTFDSDLENLNISIRANEHFRLPEDRQTPLIFISAGSGIAPFRSLVHEVIAQQRENKIWMFFGEQTRHSNFLYQKEWLDWLDQRDQDKCNVSFSRDEISRGYIGKNIIQEGKGLNKLLEDGAAVYLCGSKKTLASSVYDSFITIFEQQRSMSKEVAEQELKNLISEKRFMRDVY